MVAVPVATLVKSAVHLPADSEQLADTLPTPGFDDAKLTVPVGTFEAVVVSGTDAVQLEVPPMAIVLGLHAILEDVLSFAPVGVGLVPWGDGECSRNGTRNAPNPATISATAPSLRLLGSIILFCLPFSLGRPFCPTGILFNELITKKLVNPRQCDTEIFQEPLMGVGTRYTVTGFGGAGRGSGCLE